MSVQVRFSLGSSILKSLGFSVVLEYLKLAVPVLCLRETLQWFNAKTVKRKNIVSLLLFLCTLVPILPGSDA